MRLQMIKYVAAIYYDKLQTVFEYFLFCFTTKFNKILSTLHTSIYYMIHNMFCTIFRNHSSEKL